jgi:nicotinate-nucleotide adenylyltransferase
MGGEDAATAPASRLPFRSLVPRPCITINAMDLPALDCRRVAFFGGTFDPPHRGHLAVARAAQRALHLDAVLFVPVGVQPLKPHGSTASFEDRVTMTRLAVEADSAFIVSLADAPSASGKPNYTIDTLAAMRAELPIQAELFCLMGADSFAGLRRWHRGAEIPFVAPLIVASRPRESLEELADLLPEGLSINAQPEPIEEPADVDLQVYMLRNARGETKPFFLLPGVNVDISASAIREQVRTADERHPFGQNLLPDAVCAYIAARGIYR